MIDIASSRECEDSAMANWNFANVWDVVAATMRKCPALQLEKSTLVRVSAVASRLEAEVPWDITEILTSRRRPSE
jgi:hypothetical protein